MHIARQAILNLKKIEISEEMSKILNGIWHHRLHAYGIAFSYLPARTFHVVRYPTRPDRNVIYDENKSLDFLEAVKLLDDKSEEYWERLSVELKEISATTRERIATLTGANAIELQRALTPSAKGETNGVEYNRECDDVRLFPSYAAAAQAAGHERIAIDVDVVSGWSLSSTTRYGDLEIGRIWNIEDILLVSDMLKTQSSDGGPLEGDEWLCLNRNPNGLIELEVSKIRLTGAGLKEAALLKNRPDIARLAKDMEDKAKMQATTRRIKAQIGISNPSSRVKLGAVSKIFNRIAIILGGKGI